MPLYEGSTEKDRRGQDVLVSKINNSLKISLESYYKKN